MCIYNTYDNYSINDENGKINIARFLPFILYEKIQYHTR